MYKQSGFCHTKMSSSKVDHRKISAMILSLRKTITSRIQPKYSLGQSQYTCGQEQGVAIPNQNSAKLSVSPCFARVRFCSPVFCPFLPIFCPKMGKKWAKTGKFGFVRFCINSPEFVHFRSSCACAVRHPLVRNHQDGYPYLKLSLFWLKISRHLNFFW